MPWWTWTALAIFVVVLLGTATLLLVAGLRAFRLLREMERRLTTAGEGLAGELEALERRIEAVSEASERAERQIAALQLSLEKLSVLRWALGDATQMVSRFRSAVPRK